MLRIFVALVSITLFLAAAGLANTAQSDTYTATINLLDVCQRDAREQPQIVATADLFTPRYKRNAVVKADRVSKAGWGWIITLTLPVHHEYVWFDTTHCETMIPSMAVEPSPRTYAAILLPGGAPISLDQRDAHVAGTLPFSGVYSVDIVSPDNDLHVLAHGHVVGRSFYFENVPNAVGRLRIQFQDYSVPLQTRFAMYDTTNRAAPFSLILHVTQQDVRKALESEYPTLKL